MDTRNIIDRYKNWENDLIRQDLQLRTNRFAVLMAHIQGDFNISCVLRSANAFGAREMFYFGQRHWDRRGAVGVQSYTSIRYLSTFEDVLSLKSRYRFVALEQNPRSVDVRRYSWQPETMIVMGEEGQGLQEDVLAICDDVVEIPQFGSVRSLNVATAASIAFYDLVSKL